jgi:hypothetical protein
MKPFVVSALISLSILHAGYQNSSADWPQDGAPVSVAPFIQQMPAVAPDGAGGVIVAWLDTRNGTYYHIYAQRVDGSGDAVWATDGVAVSTELSHNPPAIVSDGASGAVIAWSVYPKVYAQRLDASGSALWTVEVNDNDGGVPTMVSDGVGGAVVAWAGTYQGVSGVYAQRIDASGNRMWATKVPLSEGAGECHPTIVSDGASGGIAMWWNSDLIRDQDIFVRRVDASGNALWVPGGVKLCDNANAGFYTSTYPVITADDNGGAIVAWTDWRNVAQGGISIYAQRVSALGQPAWAPNGVVLCNDTAAQDHYPRIVPDDAGGAIVAWTDFRTAMSDIYAGRISASGNALWTPNGVPVGADNMNLQSNAVVVGDGVGGAIVAWMDSPNGGPADFKIYAGRLDAAGNKVWAADGVPISTNGESMYPAIASDGTSGAIVTWDDYRNDYTDIFARRVLASGDVATSVTRPGRPPSLLAGEVYPNPFAGSASIGLELSEPSAVRIEVFDVAGRSVRVMALREAAVQHSVEFDGRDHNGRLLPSGVYFFRVEAAGESITRKMVIAR